jgi:GT2 family glycosyltransferase
LFVASCIYEIPPVAPKDTLEITIQVQGAPCDSADDVAAGAAATGHNPGRSCTKTWSKTIDVAVFHRLVTVITHTHGRIDDVLRLHDSVQQWFPDTTVIASEDTGAAGVERTTAAGSNASRGSTLRWLQQPPDCGLSYARNSMMLVATTPFVQLLDDDFVLDEQSHLDLLLERLLTHPGVAIASPVIPADMAKGWVFQGLIKSTKDTLELTSGDRGYVDGCTRVDYVPNVFMARKNALLAANGGWDPELKLGEHEEFFFRLR